jgi:hypothetical protein
MKNKKDSACSALKKIATITEGTEYTEFTRGAKIVLIEWREDMGNRSVVVACAFVLLSVCFIFAQASKPVATADLTDPAGDVKDKTGKDILKVSVSSDGKNIKAAVTLKDDISKTISGTMAPGEVLEMYFDTDSKDTTGGKPFWGNKKGFEFGSTLMGCIEYEGGSSACLGGAGTKIKSFFTTTETIKYTKAGANDNDSIDHFWDLPRVPLQGNKLEGSVPYEKIGVKSGQTIRVVLRESDGGFDDKSYFPDVWLMLK